MTRTDELETRLAQLLGEGQSAGDLQEALKLISSYIAPGVLRCLQRALDGRAETTLMVWYERVWKGLPNLRDPARVRPWCYIICRRLIADAHRGMAIKSEVLEPEIDRFVSEATSQTQKVLRAQRKTALLEAIDRLDQRAAQIVIFRGVDELTAEEVGEILQMSTEAVHTAYFRAKRRLRELLEQDAAFRSEDP